MKNSRIRELYKRYLKALKPWQIKMAMGRLKHFGVPLREWEDAMQELAIEIIQFRFDPERAKAASEETILCRLLDNRIRELARANGRRQACMDRLSLMAHPVEDLATPDRAAEEGELRELVGQLTPVQQEICRRLLADEAPDRIGREMGHDWHFVKRQIAAIRVFLSERGIRP